MPMFQAGYTILSPIGDEDTFVYDGTRPDALSLDFNSVRAMLAKEYLAYYARCWDDVAEGNREVVLGGNYAIRVAKAGEAFDFTPEPGVCRWWIDVEESLRPICGECGDFIGSDHDGGKCSRAPKRDA